MHDGILILGYFQNLSTQNPEQHCLVLKSGAWALRSWTRDLKQSPPKHFFLECVCV